jgi:carbonic anhydrase
MGSFTNPPCDEGKLTNVFATFIPISPRQMESFRLTNIKRNFRPVQPLNARVVEASFFV